MPNLPDKDIVTLGEGQAPIVKAGPNLTKWIGKPLDLWLFLQGKSPTGSFKDFGMTVLVSVGKAAGAKGFIYASTGDTSASAAAYAASAGLTAAGLLPLGKITPEQILQLKLFGAITVLLPAKFDVCMNVIKDLIANYGAYPANSLMPARIEGHQTTVFLAAQFFGWQLPDWFVPPIGNGSNCTSLGKGLRLMKSQGFNVKSRILGCQSKSANPMYLSWQKSGGKFTTQEKWETAFKPVEVGETIATAARIGDPVSYKKVIRAIVEFNGAVIEVSEEELTEAVIECAKDGLFLCPQSGIAMAGLRKAVRLGIVKRGERVLIISTADGLKFTKPFMSMEGKIIESPDCKTETVAKLLNLK